MHLSRFYTIIFVFLLAQTLPSMVASAFAQNTASANALEAALRLDSLHQTRLSINKTAMLTLGAWAVGNMALNGALMLNSSRMLASGTTAEQVPFYFQQMNVFWNVVNLGLAAGGYFGSMSEGAHAVSLFDAIDKQASMERILLFNAGLDVGYMAAGAWLLERSKTDTERASLWQGYGQSLILQGAFLLLFDVSVFAVQHLSTEPLLREVLTSVRLTVNSTSNGAGFGVYFVLR